MSNISDTDSASRPLQIAVVVSGWPRLSESFALNELLALHRAGMLAKVFATKRGELSESHPAASVLDQHVHHLGEGTAEQQAAEVLGILGGLHVDALHGYFAHQPAAVAARLPRDWVCRSVSACTPRMRARSSPKHSPSEPGQHPA